MNRYIGYFDVTNCGASCVFEFNHEYIKYDIVTDKVLATHKAKLYSTNKGYYFRYKGRRVYLHEVLRID